MKFSWRMAFSLLVTVSAFGQAPTTRSIFDGGLAGSLLSADTPTASVTEAKASEGWGTTTNFASGSWVEILGTNFTNIPILTWQPEDFNGNVAPTSLAGVSVSINGKPSYVYFI